MALVQWVNLEKEDIYAADADVGSKDRCGKLTVEAVFQKADVPLNFKMSVTPVGGKNAVYTAAEETRNNNFKMTRGANNISGSGTTVKIEETMKLPAAGGNKYKIEAKDANGKVVFSEEVETKRKLYYQVMTMDDANGSVAAYSLAQMEQHSLKHFIVLQKTGAQKKIAYQKTITMHAGGNIGQFGTNVQTAYDLDPKLKDVGIAAIFSDYISEMGTHTFTASQVIGTPSPLITTTPTELKVFGDMYLWHGLDDAEDIAKKWFISGEVEYVDPTNPAATTTYMIPRANIDLDGAAAFTHGGYHKVKITRDAGLNAILSKASGVINISIEVNIPVGWTNGFSWSPGGADLITCAKRTLWEDMPANTQEYTWNHEVGHRYGMVAYGDKAGITGHAKLPDGPSTLYGENRGVNDKGHAGPHCEKGAVYAPLTGQWTGAPLCVMFGQNGIGATHAPKEYCVECDPIVRKLDLAK